MWRSQFTPKRPLDSTQSYLKSQRTFCRNWQAYPKITWKFKDPEVPKKKKKSLKRNEVGAQSVSDFKMYYKALEMKTVWCWPKDRQIDQWNRIKSPEIDPFLYSQLIFLKRCQNNSIGKGKSFFKKNRARTTEYPSEKNKSKWLHFIAYAEQWF